VNTDELEQVKYDKVEIPRAELQELGIDSMSCRSARTGA